jgi:hypothetical protein
VPKTIFLNLLHSCCIGYKYTGLGKETGKFRNMKKKLTHEFFICLLIINDKRMNGHFVLCQFDNVCFENNSLKMASVSTHMFFFKSGPETVHDLSQHSVYSEPERSVVKIVVKNSLHGCGSYSKSGCLSHGRSTQNPMKRLSNLLNVLWSLHSFLTATSFIRC